jgi:CheY-like chemotaxis protein
MSKIILVAEDDHVAMSVIVAAITMLGCRPAIAMDGAACLARMNQEPPPDLVVLDLEMPKLNGLQVLSIIRQSKTADELPIVVLTGERQKHTVQAAIELGANDYLIKPLAPSSLSERLDVWIRDLDINDLIKMFGNLHFADAKMLQQPGIQPYSKLGFNAYPATFGRTTLCVLVPENLVPTNMVKMSASEILQRVVVLVKRVAGWQVLTVKGHKADGAKAS